MFGERAKSITTYVTFAMITAALITAVWWIGWGRNKELSYYEELVLDLDYKVMEDCRRLPQEEDALKLLKEKYEKQAELIKHRIDSVHWQILQKKLQNPKRLIEEAEVMEDNILEKIRHSYGIVNKLDNQAVARKLIILADKVKHGENADAITLNKSREDQEEIIIKKDGNGYMDGEKKEIGGVHLTEIQIKDLKEKIKSESEHMLRHFEDFLRVRHEYMKEGELAVEQQLLMAEYLRLKYSAAQPKIM